MKRWSLPRLALSVWFAAYAFFAFFLGVVMNNKPTIFQMIVEATITMFLVLVILGYSQES